MATTIYDIAKKVNTSAVTVSLALRGSKRVSVATRSKIEETADKMGYTPNPLARGLIGAKTKMLAFVFNFPPDHLAHDLAYTELFHTLAQVASTRGYRLFVHSSAEAMSLKKLFASIKPYAVDGIVLGTNLNDGEDKKALGKAPVPTLLLAKEFCAEKTSCLLYGGESGSKKAVEHLVELGHQRIAFVGKNNVSASTRRYTGYKKGMKKASLKLDKDILIESNWQIEDGEEAAKKLANLNNPPTAIIAATDLMAMGVLAGLKKCGLEVPKDINVIGFDNLHIGRFSIPALSSVDLRRNIIAQYTMDIILDMINKEAPGRSKMVPSKLIVRESTSEPTAQKQRA